MRMTKKFQRTTEDFTCEHCEYIVSGSGYTNHCPKCLYSKHVDINPGDRAHKCNGAMKPIAALYSNGVYTIQQECEVCGTKARIKAKENDDVTLLIELTTHVLYD